MMGVLQGKRRGKIAPFVAMNLDVCVMWDVGLHVLVESFEELRGRIVGQSYLDVMVDRSQFSLRCPTVRLMMYREGILPPLRPPKRS